MAADPRVSRRNVMFVVFVTGVRSSGKSTLARYLALNGHDAVSLDDDTTWAGGASRRWAPDHLDALIGTARERGVQTLWLVGHADNAPDLSGRFDVCALLDIDQTTVVHRVGQRRGGNHSAAALREALEGHTPFLARWRRRGAVTVDATAPVQAVARQLLTEVAAAVLTREPR
jgi:thymidylate kinase